MGILWGGGISPRVVSPSVELWKYGQKQVLSSVASKPAPFVISPWFTLWTLSHFQFLFYPHRPSQCQVTSANHLCSTLLAFPWLPSWRWSLYPHHSLPHTPKDDAPTPQALLRARVISLPGNLSDEGNFLLLLATFLKSRVSIHFIKLLP